MEDQEDTAGRDRMRQALARTHRIVLRQLDGDCASCRLLATSALEMASWDRIDLQVAGMLDEVSRETS